MENKGQKIRVLLANRPRMILDLVREIIAQEPDMEVVGEVSDSLHLPLVVKESEADVVVVAFEGIEATELVSYLLDGSPRVTVLCLATTEDTAFIAQLRYWQQEIVEPSTASVMNALRQAIRVLRRGGPEKTR